MDIGETLGNAKDTIASVASSPTGKWALIGGAALVGFLALRRSQSGGGSAVASQLAKTGATFPLGGASGSGSGLSSSSTSTTAAMTPSEQLNFMREQGKVQAEIQGLINAQNLEQQKGLLGLSIDQAKAQAAAALQSAQDQFAFWNTPVSLAGPMIRTGSDTSVQGILVQSPAQAQAYQQAQQFQTQLNQQYQLGQQQIALQTQAAKATQPNPWRIENIISTVSGLGNLKNLNPFRSVNVGTVQSPVTSSGPLAPNLSPNPGSAWVLSANPNGVIPA